ncbi:MAG: hypothetical protein ACFB16_17825 [Phormidesmis sp.]
MNPATRLSSNRIAIVFDFDETLTPEDSFRALLQYLQLDADAFESERIQPLLDQNWEKYLARAYCLVKESQQRGDNITKQTLTEVGKTIALYEGTEHLFGWLEKAIKEISTEIELEFYLISGGFVDIPRSTPLAKDFKHMWGCEFQYDDETGAIEFMKRQMTHVEKTRYLYYLSKGVDSQNETDLVYNYADIPTEELYIPLDQVVYIGDGASDVPCFAVMKQYDGVSLGIYKQDASAEDWQYLDSVGRSQRLSNLVPAGYEKDSELVRSLILSVESIAKKIAIRQINSEQ